MLLPGVVHSLHHVPVHPVGAGLHRFGKAAPGADGVQVGQPDARLVQSGPDHAQAVAQLVRHVGKGRQLGGLMLDGLRIDRLFLLIYGDLGRGGAGIDHQDFHKAFLLLFGLFSAFIVCPADRIVNVGAGAPVPALPPRKIYDMM